MQVISEGSVRVDLVGGTLDLDPINLILPNVVTLNVATGLKAKVVIEEAQTDTVVIESLDYKSNYEYKLCDFTAEKLFHSDHFKEMSFICQVLDLFKLKKGVKLTLSSGSPAGAGLGGSSSMGATLYKGMCKFLDIEFEAHQAVKMVKSCEARILNQGVPGYQDYYPALVGGVLCLKGSPDGIHLEQLYSDDLVKELESNLTLVYSGISRNSGINNWQVYKDFFDGKESVRKALADIAKISYETYLAIKNKEYTKVISLISKEGELREALAEGIVPEEIRHLLLKLKEEDSRIGLKMCGAGGGGCFLITHNKDQRGLVLAAVERANMEVLDFTVAEPLSLKIDQ